MEFRRTRYKIISVVTIGSLVILIALSQIGVFPIGSKGIFSFNGYAPQEDGSRSSGCDSPLSHGLRENPARALIDSIKERRRLASGTSDNDNEDYYATEEKELNKWKLQNPCASRLELTSLYDARKYAKKLAPNPLWDELFEEYSKLHRTCVRRVGNLADYFLTNNRSVEGCQFAVGDFAPWTGLGNQLYVTVSSLLYAILTQRVVLVPTTTLIPQYTCEPFPGSSWVLDSGKFPVPRYFKDEDIKNSLWTRNTEFFRGVDAEMEKMSRRELDEFKKGSTIPAQPLTNAISVLTQEWQPSNRFYCSAEQTYYSQATWVYLSGCIYTIPKIWATPLFRRTLEDLFPDRMVGTRLLRSLVLPGDAVWGRVRRINNAYLAGADRKVGLQIRYKDGQSQYQKMNDLVNERILTCAQNSGFLPEVNTSRFRDSNLTPENSSMPAPTVKAFVASLFPGLYERLSETFVRFPSITGEDVGLVQVSQHKSQKLEDVEEQEQAFAEVILLSLSDQLVVTPISTFGGLAQMYGALTPWFVEMREDRNLPPCQRAQTVDACDQFTNKVYDCPHDPIVDRKPFSKVLPYVKDCLTIDHDQGIQLITDFQS